MDNDRGGRYGGLVSWWARMPENVSLIEPVWYPDMQRAMGGAGEMLADYWGVRRVWMPEAERFVVEGWGIGCGGVGRGGSGGEGRGDGLA